MYDKHALRKSINRSDESTFALTVELTVATKTDAKRACDRSKLDGSSTIEWE